MRCLRARGGLLQCKSHDWWRFMTSLPVTKLQISRLRIFRFRPRRRTDHKVFWNRSKSFASDINSTRFSSSWCEEARMSIQNLQTYDPFRDAAKGVDETSRQDQPIHIRIQQRSGRKTLTTVQGINEAYDLKKLVKAFKKQFQCNGTVIENVEYGEVIQLQGDQRTNVREFLQAIGLAKTEQLMVHGF